MEAKGKKLNHRSDRRRSGLGRVLFAAALTLPMLGALTWSVWPALNTAWSIFVFKPIEFADDDFEDEGRLHDLRRQIQKHFLNQGVYIPLEDIVRGNLSWKRPSQHSLLMQKACGRGKIHVWVPFGFRLPVIGSRVVEWCWKAPLEKP